MSAIWFEAKATPKMNNSAAKPAIMVLTIIKSIQLARQPRSKKGSNDLPKFCVDMN